MTDPASRLRESHEHLATRRGLSIHVRLLLLVMAAALPALLFSFFQARAASRIVRANAEQHALQAARRIANRVDDHLHTVDGILVALGRAVRVDPAAIARNDSILVAVSRDLGPDFLNLSLAAADGRLLGLSNGRTSTTRGTLTDRRYFQDAIRTRGLGIGEPMLGRITHQPSIAIGRAILGPSGAAVGVVAASTRLDRLGALLRAPDLPEEAVVTLVDEQGRVLARNRPDPASPPGAASITERVGAMREGVSEQDGPDGVPQLSGVAPVERAPWTVRVRLPSALALARVHAQERQALGLFVGSLAVSLVLAWLLARGIADPVRTLTADAEAFVEGELLHRSAVEADGELGTLAAAFNRMIDALQRRSEQLGASELRYRTLFETMPLPMWVYDMETLRFLAVNEAALARYGYTRDEMLAMTVLEIRPDEEAGAFHATMLPGIVGPRQHIVTRHRTRSGEVLDVEISSDDLRYGAARARLVVASDITVRRRTELALQASQEQLRQSQKLEAIGSLAGGIAHDFNNLLTAILGYCDLAIDGIPEGNLAKEDVAEVRRAALRAADLTRQLLAFSRRQVLKPQVFPLGSAVASLEKILRRLISENIVLTLEAFPEPLYVCADPAQLEQVVLNLVLNARDAMPQGGRLLVRTGLVTLDEPLATSGHTLAPGRYATLEVADTGTGIAPDARDRLFEPFFTTKERGQGTGLGLATVYGIVQQSGGGIGVESAPGAGSTFTIYFPVEEGVVLPTSGSFPGDVARLATPRRRAATILLAEDDDAVRTIAREVLERDGYRVLAAADGAAALALAEGFEGRIDLLLTDVIMPGMNGRELAETLAVRRPGLRVLFASGYSDNVLLHQAALAPGLRLLDKPFTPATLAAKVAELLDGAPQPELA